MARLPRSGPVVIEPLSPAVVEEWVDVQDVEQAIAAGHRGEALLSVLALLAGEHYRDAERQRPRQSAPIVRGDILAKRPERGETNESIEAWRMWVLTGRCPFRDRDEFMSAAGELVPAL